MAKAKQNPWRRGPAQSNSAIPISARSSVALNPRGPSIGFFQPPRYKNRAQPGNIAQPIGDVPLSAMHGSLQGKVKAK